MKPQNRGVIRLDDSTSHGGLVTQVSAQQSTVDGKPVARVGDMCSCPMPGHTVCVIVEGSADHTIDGIPVAYHGHKTSCGATLISTAAAFTSA